MPGQAYARRFLPGGGYRLGESGVEMEGAKRELSRIVSGVHSGDLQRAHIHEVAGDCGGGGHGGADQVGATAGALAALEVAVAR